MYFSNIASEAILMHFIHLKWCLIHSSYLLLYIFSISAYSTYNYHGLGNLMFKMGLFILENVETPDPGD